MSIKVWPFLISRNLYLDYRTVVAPDFICELKIANLLAIVTEGELTQPGQGFVRHIIGSKVGNFTIAFRVIKATKQDINLNDNNHVLKDQFGREIYIFEGIITQGIKDNFQVSENSFENIHQKLMMSYQKFWNLFEPTSAISSKSFILDIENLDNYVLLEALKPFIINSKRTTKICDNTNTIKYPKKPHIPRNWLFFLTLLLIVGVGLILKFFFYKSCCFN